MPLAPLDAAISDDDATLIEVVHEYARNELYPLDRAWDLGESSIVEALPKLSEMGLLNLLVPAELNGLGCRYQTYSAIIHELAIWSPATAVTVAVHSLTGGIIERFAAEPRRSEWLSSWGEAESFGAFALSEAGAGSDAGSVKTTVVEVDGGFVVNGEKMWVTNGLNARWLFVLARLEGVPKGESYFATIIDGNSPGISRTPIPGKMGIRGSETAVIALSDVFVPDDHVIGKPGQGLEVCLASLGRGRVGIAAQATGIAEACFNEMVSYAREREQFGRPIGKFPAIAGMIADSAVDLEAAKLLVWRAAGSVQDGKDDRSAIAMAKLFASEAANRIAYRGVQVHGGAGYVHECRIEQLYRDARITTIYEGTSEVQRIVIARDLAER